MAGFLFRRDQLPKTKLNVAIISGGNIDPKMLEELRAADRVQVRTKSDADHCWPRVRDCPASYRDHGPHGLDQSERPRSLQKTVDGAKRASSREGQDEPPAARFQGVADQHRGYCEQTEDG